MFMFMHDLCQQRRTQGLTFYPEMLYSILKQNSTMMICQQLSQMQSGPLRNCSNNVYLNSLSNFIGQRKRKKSSSSSSSWTGDARISTTYVQRLLDRLESQFLRKSTKDNYQTVWQSFNKFLISLDQQTDRCSWEERTALFGAYLIDQGIQSSTLKCYFSAIKAILKFDKYEWNEKLVTLTSLTHSCKLHNDVVLTRLPIHHRLFEALLFELERFLSTQPYLQIMYKSIFSLAFYGLMRVGKLTL